jgi:hypothetical protein
MSRRKSWFGGVRRKFFSKRTFSEDEAVALFGTETVVGIEMGSFKGVTEVDLSYDGGIDINDPNSPPAGAVEIATAGYTEIP